MSYKPYSTSLLQLAQQVNTQTELAIGTNTTKAPSRKLWSTCPGITILLEQGCHQFKRWTGREAPRAQIEHAAWEEYLQR
jgi:pentafunctional AROM polypeptide